jgi:long-chain acyl-CoA synthetase
MLVGEGRPYCIALLWIEEKEWRDGTAGQVATLVHEVNSRLSQPERPRRWAVMKGSLSVDQGELTANLKLRRSKVEARYAGLITALYAGAKDHEDSWYIGNEEER